MKINKINLYKTIVFDCDGVILNSNKIKTEAFYEVTKKYGKELSRKLVEFHIKNGGKSRYEKFNYFLNNLRETNHEKIPSLKDLTNNYGEFVFQKVLNCDVAKGLNELRKKTSKSKWCVVSGSDEKELRKIFFQKKLTNLFNAGIYGSPNNKVNIIKELLANKIIERPGLFIGDSKYDFECALYHKMDFVFLSNWSEITQNDLGLNEHNIRIDVFKELSCLL